MDGDTLEGGGHNSSMALSKSQVRLLVLVASYSSRESSCKRGI